MSPDEPTTETAGPRPLRWLVVAAAVWAVTMFLCAGETAVFVRLAEAKFLPPLAAAALLLAASFALGDFLLTLLRVHWANAAERLLCALPVGACAWSLLALVFGSLGCLFRWVWLAALAAVCGTWIARRGRAFRGALPARFGRWDACCLAAAAPWAALCALAAFLPPWEYDVQEYHLAAPAEYWRAGKVFFLKNNVYANFPANGEMTYLLGMTLTGDRLAGAYAGKLVNAGYGLALACFAGLAAAAVFRGRWSGEAFLAAYLSPVALISSMVAYVTMPLMLYTALAAYALLRALGETEPARRRPWLTFCGLGVGAAMGVKYTAFLFVLPPAVLAAALWGRAAAAERLKRAARVALPALLVVSPWLVRNAVNTRNPVYPLLPRVFPSPNWSAEKAAKFRQAHSPKERSAVGFARRCGQFLTNEHKTYLSGSLLLLAALGLLARPRPAAGLLAAWWAAMAALWYLFTHQIDRFLAPSLALLALLAAGGACAACRAAWSRAAVRAATLAFAAFSLLQGVLIARNAGVFDGALQFDSNRKSLAEFMHQHTDFGQVWDAFEFLDQAAPASARVLFAGEARTFWSPRRAWAGTVFDDAPLAEALSQPDAEAAARWLRRRGVSHILINWREARRLAQTYAFTFRGERRPGYLDLSPAQWRRFERLKQTRLKLVKAIGKPYASGERPVEVYEVRPGGLDASPRLSPAH